MFDEEFRGKTIVITGATSGIGEDTAYRFFERGANVVISGRREEEGKKVVQQAYQRQIKANKSQTRLTNKIIFVKTDITSEDSVKAMLAKTVAEFGEFHMAFNNAGWGGDLGPLHECSAENWNNVMNVNLTGMFYCLKHQIAQFKRQIALLDEGEPHTKTADQQDKIQRNYSIVNMSSVYGLGGTDIGLSPYISSKHGVVGLTNAAALEYAKDEIRVNSVCPGWIETKANEPARSDKDVLDMVTKNHPLNRLGKTHEVADSVLFLCSSASRFITGTHLPIDGGISAKK